MNSLKMKLSVILGVVQMMLGLCLRYVNAIYEGNMTNLFCECIPMMMFMVCFFGYMDYLILYKWVTPLATPPSIINSMIAMAMGTPDENAIFGESVPAILKWISVITVPWMLIPKPVIMYY